MRMLDDFRKSIVCSASSFSSKLCCDWIRLWKIEERKMLNKSEENPHHRQMAPLSIPLTIWPPAAHDIDSDFASSARTYRTRQVKDSILAVELSIFSVQLPAGGNSLPIERQTVDCSADCHVYPPVSIADWHEHYRTADDSTRWRCLSALRLRRCTSCSRWTSQCQRSMPFPPRSCLTNTHCRYRWRRSDWCRTTSADSRCCSSLSWPQIARLSRA